MLTRRGSCFSTFSLPLRKENEKFLANSTHSLCLSSSIMRSIFSALLWYTTQTNVHKSIIRFCKALLTRSAQGQLSFYRHIVRFRAQECLVERTLKAWNCKHSKGFSSKNVFTHAHSQGQHNGLLYANYRPIVLRSLILLLKASWRPRSFFFVTPYIV